MCTDKNAKMERAEVGIGPILHLAILPCSHHGKQAQQKDDAKYSFHLSI